MALWGITDADEAKPKWSVEGGAVDPSNIFATSAGWVLRHYKNAAKTTYWDEVLVAVDGLAGAGGRGTDTLGEADITAVFFEETGYEAGATGSVIVIYNEAVNVTNGATLVVRNTTDGADITATAAGQTGTNRVEFTFTVAAQGKVHEIQAQTISGTIVDAVTGTTSDKAFVAGVGGDVIGAGGSGSIPYSPNPTVTVDHNLSGVQGTSRNPGNSSTNYKGQAGGRSGGGTPPYAPQWWYPYLGPGTGAPAHTHGSNNPDGVFKGRTGNNYGGGGSGGSGSAGSPTSNQGAPDGNGAPGRIVVRYSQP